MSRHTRPRRGIILLVVMSLIALFAVVTIGFVLVSTLELKTAIQAARAEQRGDQPTGLLDEALDQVLRGTKGDSVLRNVSLLEDLNGFDTGLLVTDPVVRNAVGAYAVQFGYNPAQLLTGGVVHGVATQAQFAKVETKDFYQLVDLTVALPPNVYFPAASVGTAAGYFNGRLLTFVSGPCAGTTVRIVDFLPINNPPPGFRDTPVVRVYSPQMKNLAELVASKFIINDRPFDGTGYGLGVNPTTGDIDKTVDHKLSQNPNDTIGLDWEQALLPNRSRAALTKDEWENVDLSYPDPSGLGGADEDYDAPDFQNMLLAMRISTRTLGSAVVLPSLHRPDLIAYWNNRMKGTTGWPDPTQRLHRDLLRKICLRPMTFDHPGFAAVNPALSTLAGLANLDPTKLAWDVDNDGDGSPDSIWVDLGLPVQTDSQGRRYKPLFAILCLDMDGRLNLNAHGAPELVMGPAGAPSRGAAKQEFIGPFANVVTPGRSTLVVGSGYGPAEIRLNELFDPSNMATTTELQQLLFGRFDNSVTPPLLVDGRYGESFLLKEGIAPMPGLTTVWSRLTTQTIPSDMDLDRDGTIDQQKVLSVADGAAWVEDLHDDNFPPPPSRWLPSGGGLTGVRGNARQGGMMYYSNYSSLNLANRGGNFASPIDVDGDGGVALDITGHPLTFSHCEANDLIDDPYEIDLTDTRQVRFQESVPVVGPRPAPADRRGAAVDMPFGPNELEALLREFDIDSATLASRLRELAPTSLAVTGGLAAAYRRNLLTTESWDLPVANLMLAMPELLIEPSGPGSNPITSQIPPSLPLPAMSPLAFRYTNLPQLALILQSLDLTGGPYAKPDFDKELRTVLYPDYFDSLRLDLGRPLGNSADDNDNGIVDEPGEATPLGTGGFEPQHLWEGSDSLIGPIFADLNGDGFRDSDDRDPVDPPSGPVAADGVLDDGDVVVRQALARHLYFLALSMRNVIMSQPTLLPGAEKDSPYKERDVAQWAVNVVDYIDRDSISTGFEFDLEPGKSWSVDGSLATDENEGKAKDKRRRAVVWGLERPELLITEAVAYHDLRTDDTNSEAAAAPASPKKHYIMDPNPDDDLDQVRKPEGTLLLEFFNPQGLGQYAPGEFYSVQTGTGPADWKFVPGVNLKAVDRVNQTDPVWRVVVWANKNGKSEEDILKLRATATFPQGYDPSEDESGLDADGQAQQEADNKDREIERSIYFVKPGTGTKIKFDGHRYYPDSAGPEVNKQAIVGYGQYAVVGPADNSGRVVIGDYDPTTTSQPKITFTAYTHPEFGATRRFTIENDGLTPTYPFYDYGQAGAPAGTEQIRLPLGVVIDGGEHGGRMSISEPAGSAYPAAALNPDDTLNPPDDEPYDSQVNPKEDWVTRASAADGDAGPDSGTEATDKADNDRDNVATPDGLLNYRFLALQRLANPLLPYNRQTNPYITVDWMPVDLTIFNSTFSPNALAKLRTRQRAGGDSNPANVGDASNIWAPLPFSKTSPGANKYREYSQRDPALAGKLDHTLGYLNERFQATSGGRWWTPATITAAMTSMSGMGYDEEYFTGAPETPFPWINLPNRPLISQYELLLVPKSSPSMLLHEFSLKQNLGTSKSMYSDKEGNFGHLLNFFGSNVSGFPIPAPHFQNDMYRLFDFMQVKSPFSGTEIMLNPLDCAVYPQGTPLSGEAVYGWFRTAAGQAGAPATPDTYYRSFRPPFNRLSAFRDPGRVNLNTIFDEGDTLQAVVGGHAADASHVMGPLTIDLFSRFLASRRGYGPPAPVTGAAAAGAMLYADVNFPSLISNPFRTFSGGYLVPLTSMQRPGVNATLLRPDPVDPSALPTPPAPLPDPGGRNDPEPYVPTINGLFELTGGGTSNVDTSTDNPYFRYQLYNRLGNLVTTRSNVYGVWITVGMFEVEPVNKADPYYGSGQLNFDPSEFDQVFPDGYRLKAEIGTDTGDIKRHRAFYLIDRSIPVGFERGESHNSRKTIILRRIIE